MAGSNFIDYVKIHLTSGNGGAGSAHLHRAKYIPKGGPDGGDGGRGGHIIVRGNEQMWTLLHLRYRKHIRADNGTNGSKNHSTGKEGADEYIEVPLGTVIKDTDTGDVLGEITESGQEIIAKRGGRGGLGNDHFKSPTNQTPRFAQPGEEGEEGWVVLELKVLADVGLVGFPNAGKSTLLSALSAAKPEIADYPFTTLVPNLGIVAYRGYQSFAMADIPGIIEGASEGKGLGHRFLRHIERNAVLLYLIPADAEDINEEFAILRRELNAFNPELLHKEQMVVISKSDMLDEQMMSEMSTIIDLPIPHMFISAVSQYNLDALKDELWKLMNK